MSRNLAAYGRKDSHVYTPQDIAAMSLDQLRELSDLQLSERELADVIEAIHTGGAEIAEDETESPLQPALPQHQCLLCQPAQQAKPAQCLVCQGGISVEDVKLQIQQLQSWLDWYRKYQLWAGNRPRGLEECQAVGAEADSA